ncbi:S-4TM family putative pore-forming effector [Candidatus Sulfurimonas baltica]|uniref:KAP NTPase domain-containing protein n=1 Tax=Candidatus Sulfurimonas baltica TaxID=2740404 RepID=A0A7S7LVR9_9BACT|nr:S-4TM family putative pore-forming effector [Candidatus Sulfurimonas baltica]QOY52280.1 hypothetical protein HUE88_00875 [Candidatus Sulfurimonas baltica]
MIDAMDNDPIAAIKKYATNFITLREVKSHVNAQNIDNKTKAVISENTITNSIQENTKKSIDIYAVHRNDGTIIARVSSDQEFKIDDELSIGSDVKALAKVIAYNKTPLPLAIGLFGRWGSGKSFFMHKLEDQINYLSSSEESVYCKHIVPIKFNAWHYSDSNLWASLVNKIFHDLNIYISGSDKKDYKTLYSKLESVKEHINEKKSQKQELEDTKKINEKELEKIAGTKENLEGQIAKLKNTSTKILQIPSVKERIDIFSNDDTLGFKSFKDIHKAYVDAKKIGTLLKQVWSLLYKSIYFWIFLIILIPFIIYYNEINNWLLSILTPSLPVILLIAKKISTVREKITPLKKIIDHWDSYEESVIQQNTEEEKGLLSQISSLNLRIINIQNDIFDESKNIEYIEKEIEDIKSGKRLASFISQRFESDDYAKHLGVISTIRNDFEALTSHLTNSNEESEYKIDRIILYIDDLDRCQPEMVMQVLEAIHLILAFDLFVVVVGVDPKWVSNSLISNSATGNNKIAPSEYLEKIFQIPFKLKNMDTQDKKNLLDSLLQQDSAGVEQDSAGVEQDSAGVEGSPDSKNQEVTRLEITKAELLFISKVVNFVGDTPRTIKRFVNIYRIIKSHADMPPYSEEFHSHYEIIVCFLVILFTKLDDDELLKDKFWQNIIKEVGFDSKCETVTGIHPKIIERYKTFVMRFSFD